ncbi:MAG: hypothetical protein JSU85_11415, partial [Candidatus Zixiibacteriota bacterium]
MIPDTISKREQIRLIEIQQEKIRIEIERRKIMQEMARRTPFHYTKYTFSTYANENWHHKLIGEYLRKAVDREIIRLMIFAPPRHMKSESLERAFSYALGKNPNQKIMIAGHSAPKATKISSHVKSNVTDKKHYEVFPDFPGINGRNTQDYWEIGNGYRGSVLAGGKTSSRFTGEGFDIAGIDDLVSGRDEAESPTFHERNFDFF